MDLHEIMLRPVVHAEEPRFKALLETHHYLGAVAKIGHPIWYVATWRAQWFSLLVVRSGMEVRRARPLDRLGSALPVRSPASDRQ